MSLRDKNYTVDDTEIIISAARYSLLGQKTTQSFVSANTRRAYATDWRDFAAFCDAHALVAMPATPQTIAAYATSLADRAKISTIRRRLATVSVLHQRAGHDSPCGHRIVRDVVRGIARELGVAPTRKDAVTLEGLRALLLAIAGDDVAAMRDRAIILLGFAAALRRSEIAALRVEDLRWSKHGLLVRIARSKTDQLGEGAELAVPFVPTESMCAARAVKRYVLAAGITSGPLFRSLSPNRRMSDGAIDGRDVARLVKKLALRARLGGDFSGHSLRSGLITSAVCGGSTTRAIRHAARLKNSVSVDYATHWNIVPFQKMHLGDAYD